MHPAIMNHDRLPDAPRRHAVDRPGAKSAVLAAMIAGLKWLGLLVYFFLWLTKSLLLTAFWLVYMIPFLIWIEETQDIPIAFREVWQWKNWLGAIPNH